MPTFTNWMAPVVGGVAQQFTVHAELLSHDLTLYVFATDPPVTEYHMRLPVPGATVHAPVVGTKPECRHVTSHDAPEHVLMTTLAKDGTGSLHTAVMLAEAPNAVHAVLKGVVEMGVP